MFDERAVDEILAHTRSVLSEDEEPLSGTVSTERNLDQLLEEYNAEEDQLSFEIDQLTTGISDLSYQKPELRFTEADRSEGIRRDPILQSKLFKSSADNSTHPKRKRNRIRHPMGSEIEGNANPTSMDSVLQTLHGLDLRNLMRTTLGKPESNPIQSPKSPKSSLGSPQWLKQARKLVSKKSESSPLTINSSATVSSFNRIPQNHMDDMEQNRQWSEQHRIEQIVQRLHSPRQSFGGQKTRVYQSRLEEMSEKSVQRELSSVNQSVVNQSWQESLHRGKESSGTGKKKNTRKVKGIRVKPRVSVFNRLYSEKDEIKARKELRKKMHKEEEKQALKQEIAAVRRKVRESVERVGLTFTKADSSVQSPFEKLYLDHFAMQRRHSELEARLQAERQSVSEHWAQLKRPRSNEGSKRVSLQDRSKVMPEWRMESEEQSTPILLRCSTQRIPKHTPRRFQRLYERRSEQQRALERSEKLYYQQFSFQPDISRSQKRVRALSFEQISV